MTLYNRTKVGQVIGSAPAKDKRWPRRLKKKVEINEIVHYKPENPTENLFTL